MFRYYLMVATALVAAYVGEAGTPVVTDCSGGTGIVPSLTFDINPTSVDVGGTLNVTAHGIMSKAVTGVSTFAVSATYNSLPIYSNKGSCCEDNTFQFPMGMGSIYFQKQPCPMAQGDAVDLLSTTHIAENALKGKFNLKYEAKTADGEELSCVNVAISL